MAGNLSKDVLTQIDLFFEEFAKDSEELSKLRAATDIDIWFYDIL